MISLLILIPIGLIILWFVIAPLFPRIGGFITDLWENATGVDDKENKDEKEN